MLLLFGFSICVGDLDNILMSLFIKNLNSLANVNHINTDYLHLKIKIDKVFLNSLPPNFWAKIQNTWTQIDVSVIF